LFSRVSVRVGCGLEDWVSIPDRGRISLFATASTSSRETSVSYKQGIENVPRIKRPKREAKNIPPTGTEGRYGKCKSKGKVVPVLD
jgi:hypothetical protein